MGLFSTAFLLRRINYRTANILRKKAFPMSIDNNQEYEAELITLIDDEGTEHEFEIIDELENDDGYFMAPKAKLQTQMSTTSLKS